MKFVIEPSLLALDEYCTEKEFKDYLKRVIGWEKWMNRFPEDVFILSSTEDILSMAFKYPVYPVFDKLLKKFNIDYVKACDLNMTIGRLLKANKIDKIEGNSVTANAIKEKITIKVKSNGNLINGEDKCTLHELLWNVYCRITSQNDNPDTYLIFVKNLSESVIVNVEYLTLEESKNELINHSDNVVIRCHSSIKDFFLTQSTPDKILSNVTSKEDLSLAICVSVYQRGNLKKWIESIDDYKFFLQDSFYKDYCDAHYDSNTTIKNRLMEEMSNVLLNQHLENREDWRTDKGGNSEQEIVQGYYAWRWFVTRSVKMMYWQKEKYYKFANVKEHDIFVCHWENC